MLAGFVVFFILSTAVQGFLLVSFGQEFEHTVDQGAEEIAQQAMDGVISTLEREGVMLQAMLGTPTVVDRVQEQNVRMNASARPGEYLDRLDRAWLAGNTTLIESVTDNPLSDELRERTDRIRAVRAGEPIIVELFVTDRYGGLVAALGRPTDFDQSDERWWTVARNGTMYIDDAGYDRSSGEMAVTIAAPLREDAGTVIGTFKAVIDIDDPARQLTEVNTRIINTIFFVNRTDHILWARDGARVGERLQVGTTSLPYEGVVRGPLPAGTQQTEWAVTTGGDHPAARDLGMRLVTVFDPETTGETRERMVQQAAVSLGLVLILGVGGMFFVVRYLNRPLWKLQKTLDELSRGDLSAEIDASLKERDDEIGDLARAFDRLLASMRLAAARTDLHTPGELQRIADELGVSSSALEKVPIGVVITDPAQEDNPIVYVNRAFADMTGYDPHEVEGKNCRFLQGPDTDEETVKDIAKAIDAERPITREIVNYTKEGKRFKQRLTITPVYDEQDALQYFAGFQIRLDEEG